MWHPRCRGRRGRKQSRRPQMLPLMGTLFTVMMWAWPLTFPQLKGTVWLNQRASVSIWSVNLTDLSPLCFFGLLCYNFLRTVISMSYFSSVVHSFLNHWCILWYVSDTLSWDGCKRYIQIHIERLLLQVYIKYNNYTRPIPPYCIQLSMYSMSTRGQPYSFSC